MNKKLPAIFILMAMLTLSFIPNAQAAGLENFKRVNTYKNGQYTDVREEHWFSGDVKSAFELGLVAGTSATEFEPDGAVTLGQAAALAARLHNIYAGGDGKFVQGDPWYQVYVDYAVENGIIKAGEYANFDDAATRMEFTKILSEAFPESALPKKNNVPSIPDVEKTDKTAFLYRLYEAGILSGNNEYGLFDPESNVKRSEMAAIVNRMADTTKRQSFTPKAHTGGHYELIPQKLDTSFSSPVYDLVFKSGDMPSGHVWKPFFSGRKLCYCLCGVFYDTREECNAECGTRTGRGVNHYFLDGNGTNRMSWTTVKDVDYTCADCGLTVDKLPESDKPLLHTWDGPLPSYGYHARYCRFDGNGKFVQFNVYGNQLYEKIQDDMTWYNTLKSIWACPECHLTKDTIEEHEHEWFHLEGDHYTCHVCGKQFINIHSIYAHMRDTADHDFRQGWYIGSEENTREFYSVGDVCTVCSLFLEEGFEYGNI